ncbi:MAG: Sporulation initiation factor Spo0A terminal [Clostridia bacterium]|jgi:hypothetical protein|nr:Sporulation initiation factor Spo0A terminal [Clostridia bacterium]
MKEVVNVFIGEDVLIRITTNIKEADYIITNKKRKTNKNKSDNPDIRKYLLNNKISLNGGGFNYLISAINIVYEKLENKEKYSLSKDVYPVIAEIYSVTELSVMRAIWNAIDRSDAKGIGTKRFIEKYRLGM